ncbi:Nucleotidyltransferase domain protein [compost metagenome]
MEERAAVVRVAARYGVANVRLFGSVARGEDRVDSDVDLLVDLDPQVGLFTLAALEAELGEMLGRTVDVVPARSLRPEVAATVDSIAL